MNSVAARFLNFIRVGVLVSAGRFPLLITCTSVLAVVGILLVHDAAPKASVIVLQRVLMSAALGVPLAFGITIFRERNSAGRWLELVGLCLLAVYFSLPKAGLFDEPYFYGIQWAFLLAGLHCFCAVIGFLIGTETRGFWQFNRQIFSRFILVSIYSAVLLAGMELALLSADKLFTLKLKYAYADTAILIIGFFHPLFFVAGVPADWKALDSEAGYPRVMKVFTQAVLAPLVAVFTGILYVYALKIAMSREWPHGWVALPVLLLSVFGILAALLLHPLKSDPEERWSRWFTRYFPRALAPLAVLLLLSVRVRISEYGLTELRYVGISAACWLLGWCFAFTWTPSAGIRWVPFSLALIALASGIGPASATALSKKSQQDRFLSLIKTLKIREQMLNPQAPDLWLGEKNYRNLEKILRYLIETHGKESVATILEPIWKSEWNQAQPRPWVLTGEILSSMRVRESRKNEQREHHFWRLERSRAFSESGFLKTSIFPQLRAHSNQKATDGEVWIILEQGALKLGFAETGPFTPVPLEPMLAALPFRSDSNLSPELLRIDWMHEGHSFRIVFRELDGAHFSNGTLQINACELVLFER
jgi:hypothetical protein